MTSVLLRLAADNHPPRTGISLLGGPLAESSEEKIIPISPGLHEESKFQKKYYPDPDAKTDDALSRASFLHSFGGENAEIFSSLELSKMEFPDPEWVAEGIIPEGLTILAGKQKVGKSFFTLELATAVSTGTPFLGEFACKKRGVLYVSLEENKKNIADRLNTIKGLPSADLNVIFDTAKPNLGAIPGYIERFPNTGLIVIDTLGNFLKQFNMNDYGESLEAVHAIKTLCDECTVSILANHHTRKMVADDFVDSVSGSNAITATADTTMVLVRRRGDVTGYVMGTGRNVLEYEHALSYFSDEDHPAWQHLGSGTEIRRSEEQKKILQVLEEEGEPVSSSDVAAMTGANYNTTRSALSRLKSAGLVRRAGRGMYSLS